MSISPDAKALAPRMCIFITQTEDKKKLEAIFNSMNIPIYYQCRGQGTAKSELMDILGFGGTARLITVGIMSKSATKDLFEQAGQEIFFHQRGGGIVITVPITGMQSPLFNVLNDEAKDALEKKMREGIERDMAEVHEKSSYNVIWVSVEAGYSDEVVDTARAAGAKGGTILHGRRRNSEQISRRFGISMQDEQDFVMIIAPREKKSDIMSAICTSCGLHTPAHGIVISLPVDDAIGLER